MDTRDSATAELRRMVFGFRISQLIRVCAEMQISDAVADGPSTTAQLAAATGSHEATLRRLLRAAAALGLYREDPSDTFANTDLGEALRSDHPAKVCDIAKNVGRPYFWDTWSHLLETVQTGDNTFQRLHGMSVWGHRAVHPDDGAAFDRAMTAMSLGVIDAISGAFDPADARSVVDVGGGQGALLAAILTRNPGLRGALFDQPPVVAAAPELLRSAGVDDRCDVLAGSFLESVPGGFDVYLLKSVLHDWDDDAAVEILRVCRDAVEPGTRVVVVERVLPGPNEGLDAKISDVNMLVMPGGRERTADEYGALLARAGLRLSDVVSTGTDFAIMESVAV